MFKGREKEGFGEQVAAVVVVMMVMVSCTVMERWEETWAA
jgi:hypothetical protein